MFSKEEKLRYAEALRQQIKEKQDQKKNQQRAKRALTRPAQSQSDRAIVPDASLFNQKDSLQQQLQVQDYNPFGRAGGGAPNVKGGSQNIATVSQNKSYVGGYPSQQPIGSRDIHQYSAESQPPVEYRNANQNSGVHLQPATQQYQQQGQRSAPYLAPQQAYQQDLQLNSAIQQQYSPGSHQRTEQTYVQPQQQQQQPQRVQFQQNPTANSRAYRQQYQQEVQNHAPSQRERIKTQQNDVLHEVYKKGGRNLLRLENETINEHQVKQRQKQEMQAFLKQQMEEAQRKKQEEKDRIKREELEEERKNKQYIERQTQKLKDEEDKKNQEKQKIIDQNLRNIQRKRQDQQNIKNQADRQYHEQQRRKQHEIQLQRQRQAQQRQHVHQKIELPRNPSSESVSETSSNTSVYSKGFNTNVSKQFVKKERDRQADRHRNDKKLEVFTSEIQKMKDEIVNQGQVFQKQLDKIKRQASEAQDSKRQAQLQLQRLRLQLQKKNKQSQLRLLQALKRNDPVSPQRMAPEKRQHHSKQYQFDSLNELEQDEYSDRKPYGMPSRPPVSPPMAKQKQRVYEHQNEPEPVKLPPRPAKKTEWEQQYRLEESNIGTLDAESKKIPLNLQGGNKLSMSGIENINNGYNFGKSQSQSKAFRDEAKQSRGSRRTDKDQLDRLVDNKWEMSTVKEDITKEIEELLKKKDSDNFNGLQPSQAKNSKAMSRVGIPYEGPALNTLNSNKASLVSQGTFDIDRIHGRNDARLRELKALGVETVNTNNDEDLNRLNSLLNNY